MGGERNSKPFFEIFNQVKDMVDIPKFKSSKPSTRTVLKKESDGVSRYRPETVLNVKATQYTGFFSPDAVYNVEYSLPTPQNRYEKQVIEELEKNMHSPNRVYEPTKIIDENFVLDLRASKHIDGWWRNVNLKLKPTKIERIR